MKQQPHLGAWFRGLAIAHGIVGLAVYHAPLRDILGAGLWNTIDGHTPREAAFWFLMFAPLLYLAGQLGSRAYAESGTYPSELIRTLLLVCLIGSVLMPVSGFPVGLAVCLLHVRATRQRQAKTA